MLRKINRALAAREEHGKLRAVLFINIDDLKATNDTLGHTAGDDVLRSAAQCLQRVMSDGDVARPALRFKRVLAALLRRDLHVGC
ncbi:diguanylate cyclase domain-containing protein [Mycobacterium sp. ITM-2016-00318]|uniref:diguanylate cyclase domain-containing protein n=1 Tax=Mycobacterium sp. ITM-2016-00318 TaxID=2099693 RepID=UPI001E438147|nr:diguanylate cyclase [Mycobacterium sp. ITM-2016-00318]WNG93579.1 diguanylate cyclase [Mycobacterium sp. ITM-2016-00318]